MDSANDFSQRLNKRIPAFNDLFTVFCHLYIPDIQGILKLGPEAQIL